jgi:general secretion pathway protein G
VRHAWKRSSATGLLAVLALLALGQSRSPTAMTQIKILEAALETFRMDNGRYPTTEEGLAALVARPPALAETSAYPAGGYLRERRVPLDPWGNAYEYRNPSIHGASGFDLWSLGADGAPGGSGIDADLGNWPGGFAEHRALQRRQDLLFWIPFGAAAGAVLGLPVYLFGLLSASLGRRSWSSALTGAPLAVAM